MFLTEKNVKYTIHGHIETMERKPFRFFLKNNACRLGIYAYLCITKNNHQLNL